MMVFEKGRKQNLSYTCSFGRKNEINTGVDMAVTQNIGTNFG